MTRTLPEVLASLERPPLVVVGDLLLDRYLTGVVERISPEAPIQVLRVESEVERLGGAGSVAVNVAVLGARTTLLGATGRDRAATRIRALAEDAGVGLVAVEEDGRRTGVKTRHLARSHTIAQQVLRVDEETIAPIAEATAADLRRRVREALEGARALVLSDYGKGVLTAEMLRFLIDTGRAAGLPVVVDPKGDRFERYRGATCVTPNRPETRVATGIAVTDLASAERAAERLIEDVGLEFALITLDREGMFLKARGEKGVHLPTTPREVFDVTGAGDMVLSVLAVALGSGATPLEAAGLANVAAGLEVERVGVVPITREEIAARLAAGAEGLGAKRVHRTEARALGERLRAAGKRIAFTNGCFDVLHAGHVRYLHRARGEGDVLVVGVNDDGSVARIKGPKRPVNGLEDRLEVLAALSSVDHLVSFSEDVPERLIEEIAPDVLVKGEDWREKGVVGRAFVEARGGRVVLVPLLEGRSTTDTLRRMGTAD